MENKEKSLSSNNEQDIVPQMNPQLMPSMQHDVLWNKLKNVQINLFGLPNQKICDYCDPILTDPQKLSLKLKPAKKTATAIVSALSEALKPHYTVDLVEQYYIISEV